MACTPSLAGTAGAATLALLWQEYKAAHREGMQSIAIAGDDGCIAVKQNSPVLRHGGSHRIDIVRFRTIGCPGANHKATEGAMSDRGFMFWTGQRLRLRKAAKSAQPRAKRDAASSSWPA